MRVYIVSFYVEKDYIDGKKRKKYIGIACNNYQKN